MQDGAMAVTKREEHGKVSARVPVGANLVKASDALKTSIGLRPANQKVKAVAKGGKVQEVTNTQDIGGKTGRSGRVVGIIQPLDLHLLQRLDLLQ
jgi:hypothetical protein